VGQVAVSMSGSLQLGRTASEIGVSEGGR